jgi:DNA-binding cell septation regulator SpoVG
MGTVADANTVSDWLRTQSQLLEEHNFDRLKEIVYERYKELKIEPPPLGRVDRIIRSAVNSLDEQFYTITLKKLQAETLEKLEALLTTDDDTAENTSSLFTLKSEAGAVTLESVLSEIAKLERIHSLSLPSDLFVGVSRKRLLWCKQRIAVEDLHEIRRHPESIRYSLLAAFCHERKQEITDTLLKLLINIIHKIGSQAVYRVNKRVIKEIKRVQGKNKLLFDVASASLDHPEGKVKDIIYPIAGKQTLRDLIRKYADKNQVHYAEAEQAPM